MKIAVVGSGISGLAAAWLLSKKHEVHLFEKNAKLGGHTNTIVVDETIPVDTGFLVHNDRTYPELIQLFNYLRIETVDSKMTLSIKIKDINLEWAGNSLATLFSQKKNLISFRFWRMIKDIFRFNFNKSNYIKELVSDPISLGEFLANKKLSKEFIEWYLIPMGGSIWSCSTEQMMTFPASTFLQFCENHGLLQITNRPQWKTIQGGNFQYVDKMKKDISNIHYAEPVLNVTRDSNQVRLTTKMSEYHFEKVIFACHPPDTLKIVTDLASIEAEILNSFKYQDNKTYLHNDEEFLPSDKRNWSSWNFESIDSKLSKNQINVSYWINNLQLMKTNKNMIVTLNPKRTPKKLIEELDYKHPLFDEGAINAQKKLSQIQGNKNTYYCGAWTQYGFHEDGLKSAIQVAKHFNIEPPWVNS